MHRPWAGLLGVSHVSEDLIGQTKKGTQSENQNFKMKNYQVHYWRIPGTHVLP
jgi:hypothetical protein